MQMIVLVRKAKAKGRVIKAKGKDIGVMKKEIGAMEMGAKERKEIGVKEEKDGDERVQA